MEAQPPLGPGVLLLSAYRPFSTARHFSGSFPEAACSSEKPEAGDTAEGEDAAPASVEDSAAGVVKVELVQMAGRTSLPVLCLPSASEQATT